MSFSVSKGRIPLPPGWSSVASGSVLKFNHEPEKSSHEPDSKVNSIKVAGFDFDGCLWKQSFSREFKFPDGLLFKNTAEKFK